MSIESESSPKINSSIKSRLSLNVNNSKNNTQTSKFASNGARLTITSTNDKKSVPGDGLYSSREEKSSVFERIKEGGSGRGPLASRLSAPKTKSVVGEANKAAIVRSLGNTGSKSGGMISAAGAKSKNIPVTVTFRGQAAKPSIKDRLSFN